MKKLLIGLILVACSLGVAHAYTFEPGTVSTIESANTTMVKTNIDGVYKEATFVIPYIKTESTTIETMLVSTSGVEYPHVFTPGVTRIQFQAREAQDLLYTFNVGGILSGNYFTLKAGLVYFDQNIFARNLTVYMGSSTSEAITVEFQTWE